MYWEILLHCMLIVSITRTPPYNDLNEISGTQTILIYEWKIFEVQNFQEFNAAF